MRFPTTPSRKPRILSFNARGELTEATAQKALTNGEGSEGQLIGDAVVTREAVTDAAGVTRPRLEFRGEFLHAFLNTERVKSHKPVTLTRGTDRFTADSMDYDNLEADKALASPRLARIELLGKVNGEMALPYALDAAEQDPAADSSGVTVVVDQIGRAHV